MLLIDVMAGKTSEILELLQQLQSVHVHRKSRNDTRVRAYVVGAYWRRKPRRKIVSLEVARAQRELKKTGDALLKRARA